MSYIPNTQLINPNQDAMSGIIGDQFIDPTVSEEDYWVHLGGETCNLRGWSTHSNMILVHCFGTSSKNSIYICKFYKLINELKYRMDEIVCARYPLSQGDIEYNGKKIDICKLFYHNETLTKYPVKYSCEYKNQFKEFKKTLTSQDKQYILTFVERTKALIDYFETKFDLYNDNYYRKKLEKKRLFAVINKFKKLFAKENIINDIAVKERP